ncbi:MAG TPA: ATP-binding protein [Steroidobacteraceae bacterium]|jgi:signal transduction histidine kinase
MKFGLPQSLFARLLSALLAVIGITLVVIVVLILQERRDLMLLGSGAWGAASAIADTSTDLAGMNAEARAAALQQFRTEPVVIEDSRPRRPSQRRQDIAAIEKAFVQRIRQQLGDGYKVSIAPAEHRSRSVVPVVSSWRLESRGPGPGGERRLGSPPGRLFDVTVALPDGDQIVFRAPAPQPGPPLPREIFIQLAVLTAVLAVALYLMTRTITRPLSDLAKAADAVGRGDEHPPLEERGARELRNATRAFNSMQDRLRRYLDSRTRVLAAMSHDLRTPLTRLRLRAETIEDPETRERFAADLDEMNQMVSGALNLFKGLTDTESTTPLMVDDVLQALQSEYRELGENFAIEGQSTRPVLAKPNALKRCLSNLLHNAVKYGTSARVSIEDGRELVVRIRDEGPGIPPEVLEQVFEPFYRVESSRSRDTGGTGLGLSIARDIAQAHGGSIVLRNLPERGLEAVLTLPHATNG